tara:strand:+ start:174 stop:728 length:555 start_codon:yes stop_codon:yes gene_type:complete
MALCVETEVAMCVGGLVEAVAQRAEVVRSCQEGGQLYNWREKRGIGYGKFKARTDKQRFDLKCEIDALKEEAVVAQNAEAEFEMTLSELREELAEVNKKLEDQEIYGIDPNDDGEPDQSEEIEELRKSIVNGMSLKQAKSILDPAKQKHLDCPKRGDCDTEDTVLGRLWEFIQEDGWKSKYMCM